MRRNLGVASLAGLFLGAFVMATGCEPPKTESKATPKPTPSKTETLQAPLEIAPAAPTADGWKVVYTADFKADGKLPAEWQAIEGEAKIQGGALLLKGDEQAQVVLLEPRAPGSVRVEFVGSLAGNPISDISPFVNADTSGEGAGYLFQFGGKGNALNDLCRCDDHISATEKDKPLVKPGQKYTILAENDGGHLRFLIDGQEILQYTDPQPLKGPSHDRIGFYTWGCTLTVEKLTVSAKPAAAAGK